MAAPLVEVEELHKRFGERVALADLSFTVGAGEIVGLVGTNGSGKSTLLKLLAGLLRPTSGRVRLFGRDPFRAREQVMREARFAFAPPALLDALTAREQLALLASIGAPDAAATPAAVAGALAAVGLGERADDRVRAFSFGMRQRLALALALLPLPRLLVLDEPTEGLDPAGVRELRELLLRLRAEHGVAIVVASHVMVEVESLVDRLLVLAEGRRVYCGSIAELRAGGERLRIVVDDGARAAALLERRGLVVAGRDGDALALALPAPPLAELQEWLRAGGVALESYHRDRASLEQALLERAAREGDA